MNYQSAQRLQEQANALAYAKNLGWPVEPSSPTLMQQSPTSMQDIKLNDILLTYPSVFESILNHQEASYPVYEDGICAAVVDKNPVAPLHIVIFPKDRSNGLTRLSNVHQQHVNILGHLIYVATTIAKQFRCDNGYRLVINDGVQGGQTEPHVAVHLIGLRQMSWPPG